MRRAGRTGLDRGGRDCVRGQLARWQADSAREPAGPGPGPASRPVHVVVEAGERRLPRMTVACGGRRPRPPCGDLATRPRQEEPTAPGGRHGVLRTRRATRPAGRPTNPRRLPLRTQGERHGTLTHEELVALLVVLLTPALADYFGLLRPDLPIAAVSVTTTVLWFFVLRSCWRYDVPARLLGLPAATRASATSR